MDWACGTDPVLACAGAARRIAGARSRVRHAYPRRSNTAARQGGARLPGLEPRTISGTLVEFPAAQANPYREPSAPVPDRYEAGFPDGTRAPVFGIRANDLADRAARSRRTGKNTGKALETALLGRHCTAISLEESLTYMKTSCRRGTGN